jgi:hypothetical protein
MKLRWLLSLTLLLLMAPLLIAQDDEKADKKQDEEPTVAEQFRDMKSAFSKEMRAFSAKVRKAKAAERSDIMKEQVEFASDMTGKVMELVDSSEDQELSASILAWVAQNDRGENKAAAVEQLLTDFPESEELATIATSMGRAMPEPKNEVILRSLIENSPHDSVKANATLSLVNMLSSMNRFADMPKTARAGFVKQMGEGGEEFLDKWTAEAVAAETEKLLEAAMESYADVPYGRGSTVGEFAENKLFSIKYLQIGKVAPDIEGSDLDEVEFKLSDYRGKVVVIDFWGDW